MIDQKIRSWTEGYRALLGIPEEVRFRRVTRGRWEGNRGNYHVIGALPIEGLIFYSRRPTQEEILHELAHIRWPHLCERDIREIVAVILPLAPLDSDLA